MYMTYTLTPPPALPITVNVFFVVLAFAAAVVGSYTAVQFTEALVVNALGSSQKRSGAGLHIFAASFSIAVNSVWTMHFLAMSAFVHGGFPVRYNLAETIGSMVYVDLAAMLAYALMTCHRQGLHGPAAGSSKYAALYFTMPSDTASLVEQGTFLLKMAQAMLSWRLAAAGTALGSGILAMHYAGMMAMRSKVQLYLNPVMIAVAVPTAAVVGMAIVVILFSLHGLRRRLAASVILGIAVQILHYYGFLCGTYGPLDDKHWDPAAWDGQFLVDAEVACVVVMLLSSLVRFFLMGLTAASSE